MGNNFVYMIQVEYSTDDNTKIETYLFYNLNKAKETMMNIINNEKTCWYKNVFNKKGKIIDKNYVLNTNIDDSDEESINYYWNISCNVDWYLFTNISLREIEVEL